MYSKFIFKLALIAFLSGIFHYSLTAQNINLLNPLELPSKDDNYKQKQKEEKAEDKKAAKIAKQRADEARKEMRETEKSELAFDKQAASEAKEKMKDDKYSSIEVLKWKHFKEIGDSYFLEGLYEEAIKYYKSAYNDKPKKGCMACKIAESYNLVRDYKSAERWYRTALNQDSTKNKLLYYFHALSIKQQGKYEQAINEFKRYQKLKKLKKDKELRYKQYARVERFGCEQALIMADTFSGYVVRQLDKEFNTPNLEVSPAFKTNTSIVYSSVSPEIFSLPADIILKSRFARLYEGSKFGGKWQPGNPLPETINKSKKHIVNASISPDETELYYTECTFYGTPIESCAIYVSKWKNDSWQSGQKLSDQINVPGTNTSYPNMTIDDEGKPILYFASNRRPERGMDIYYSYKKEDGTFSRAKSAGSTINTSRDDISPFYDPIRQVLYFSSNGLPNAGGFDIYKAQNTGMFQWEKPVNMGFPINSPADDRYFALNISGDRAIFSSNRKGSQSLSSETCCDDLFEVIVGKPLQFAVSGFIYGERNGSRLIANNGAVNLFKSKNDSLVGSYAVSEEGRFVFDLEKNTDYIMIAVRDDFEDLMYNFSTKGVNYPDTIQFDLVMKSTLPDEPEIPVVAKETFIGKIIGTVFFEFNEFRLKKEAPATLDSVVQFLYSHPTFVMEIGGHTDDLGSKEYNLQLSLERATAVKKYFLSRNIHEMRLAAKGYGETKPLLPNRKANGSDNPAGRERNRRTEFKILNDFYKVIE